MRQAAVESKPEILVTESAGFSARAGKMLREAGSLRLAELDRQQLLEAAPAAEILWIRLRHQIDAEVMDAAPRLRIIVTPTTGLNHIDQNEAAKRGIQVLSLRGETEFLKNVRATAEHTVGLMLALLRNTPQASAHAAGGGWGRDLFRGRELYGKTAGIVGYGRLGRIVAPYLQAFGMEILASDPHVRPEEMEPGVRLVPLQELLEKADIVSLHVSLSEETEGFFGRREMEAIKPGAWFINTARGELVDESALLEALQNGRLSGAALDVLVDERSSGMGDHPLVKYAQAHPNVIVTPHIGGCTVESMENTENFMAGKLCALLKSEAR
jgi:D-3-phosphoglycerate dehydrogenase